MFRRPNIQKLAARRDLKALGAAIGDSDQEVRREAAGVLLEIRDPDCVRWLLPLVRPPALQEALAVTAALGSPAQKRVVAASLASENVIPVEEFGFTAGSARAALDLLREGSLDAIWSGYSANEAGHIVRLPNVMALGALPDPAATEALVHIIGEENHPRVTSWALMALRDRDVLRAAKVESSGAVDARDLGEAWLHLAGGFIGLEWIDEARAAIEVAAHYHRRAGDGSGEGGVRQAAAQAFRRLGAADLAMSQLRAWAEAAGEHADMRQEAMARDELGAVLRAIGDLEGALAESRRGLELWRSLGDSRGESISRNYLGITCVRLGRDDEAHEHLGAALAIAREIGDQRVEAAVLDNLGNLALRRGASDEAETSYQRAYEIGRALGDELSSAISRFALGNLYESQGRIDDARGHYEAAGPTFARFEDPRAAEVEARLERLNPPRRPEPGPELCSECDRPIGGETFMMVDGRPMHLRCLPPPPQRA